MRALPLLLLLLATPALALDQSQIQSACYTDCEKETGSNQDYKACLARAADTADGLLNQEFATNIRCFSKDSSRLRAIIAQGLSA